MRDRWLAAVLLAAAALRLWGLGHGLPFVYNPDEANIMARALSLAQDPNPHYFLYPSFFFYVVFAAMGGLFLAGQLVGRYRSLGDFEARFFEDPTDFYLVGRAVGVVAALATIVLTYRLASRHFGRTAARAAALFLGVAYFHVRDAHYLKHDVFAGLLVVVALSAFGRAMERKSSRAYLGSGAAMGVAFATHYYTVFLAPAFLICHVVSSGLRGLGRVVLAALASAVTVFVLSPFVVLELPTALEHMKANRQVVLDRSLEGGSVLLPSLPAYVAFLAEQGVGYLLLGLIVLGWVLVARRDRARVVLWGAFPLFFLVLISYTFFAGRYLNPIAPSLAVAGGVAVGAIERRWGSVAAVAIALAACIQPLYRDIQVDLLFAGEDTRTLARQWILENIPDGATIALQSYSVPLPQSLANLRESLAAKGALDELERRGKFSHLADIAERTRPSYRLVFLGRGDEKDRIYLDYREATSGDLQALKERGVETVVLRRAPVVPPPDVAALFDQVASQGRLLVRFTPFREGAGDVRPYLDNEDWPPRAGLLHRGPVVEVWSLR